MRLLTIIKSYVLSEGRKDYVYDKYLKLYQSLGDEFGDLETQLKSLIKKFSEADPSTNNKYLDWMVSRQFDILKGDYQIPPEVNVDDFIINLVLIFHNNLSHITPNWAKMKGFPKKIADNPRDINNYNVRDMKLMINMLEREKSAAQNVSDAHVLFENDRWLIISPKSYAASCKYGAGTKWCVASKKDPTHYQNYTVNGRLVFVIDKHDQDFTPGLPYNENPMYKIAVHYKPSSNSFTIWNAPDIQIGSNLSNFFAPNIQKIIVDFVKTPISQNNWRDNKKTIENWLATNPGIYEWTGYLGPNFCYMVNNNINYHLRVFPYNLDLHNSDPNPAATLRVELWNMVNGARQLHYWNEPLSLDTQNPIQDAEAILNNIISGPADYDIMADQIYLALTQHELYNGWKFNITYHDHGNRMEFECINSKLSSYYWDKYQIVLTLDFWRLTTTLDCQYRSNTGKPINRRVTNPLDLSSDAIIESVTNLKEQIKQELQKFLAQTANK